MKLFAAVLILSATCWGQKYCAGGAPPKNDPDCIPAARSITGDPKTHTTVTRQPDGMVKIESNPAPLKCGKYQHEQKTPAHCANTCSPEGTACTAQCIYVDASDTCADDLHTLTEKEWQETRETKARLNELDKAYKNLVCSLMEWRHSVSTDGGKTETQCATLKPKP